MVVLLCLPKQLKNIWINLAGVGISSPLKPPPPLPWNWLPKQWE